MNDRVVAGDELQGLALLGEVCHRTHAMRGAVMHGVYVEDLMTLVSQITHHPRAGLASAPGHNDLHLGSILVMNSYATFDFWSTDRRKRGRRSCLL